MIEILDDIEPVIEGNGSSVSPFVITGIVVGALLIVFLVIMLLRKKK